MSSLVDEKWKSSIAGGGGHKKIFQYCTDASGEKLHVRALQGHSGRNLIDPSSQDNVLIPDGLLKYIYHVGCAINLHSIINSGLIPGGQNLSNRQTVLFQPVDPMDKEHKDPDTIDLGAPRLAQYMHKAWKKHQNTVYWVDIDLALKKGLKVYQTRSNAIILHETLPAYCIPKAIMMKSGAVTYEKVYASPLPPPKISFKDNWMTELGSEVAGGGKDSQQTQPKTKNPIVRTGRPVLSEQQSGSSVQEIENVSNVTAKSPMKEQDDLFSSCAPVSDTRSDQDKDADENVDADHVRTGRPVCEQPPDLFTQCEDIDIDFRVSGLPHAVVKQAENFRVRELVKKIEGHPHRRVLQADLKQNNTYNPFSEESKVMIPDMGKVELFELCETIPKVQLLIMPSLLESRNCLLHLWASLERE